ncbi:phospholipase D/nuclease [Serendipita vermifera]|nr:phospholipase D/nuclease [Serendipita vermifera]
MSLFTSLGKLHDKVHENVEKVVGGTVREIKGKMSRGRCTTTLDYNHSDFIYQVYWTLIVSKLSPEYDSTYRSPPIIVGRHDDADEKARDAARQKIMNSHRFQSFSQERDGNICKWHVDGHDFMWALSELIDSAKETICILDWWLSPELYLRRPPAFFPEWRLDRLLLKKAQQGVKVHVIVYKEVTQTMSMSSKHTKDALESLHPNIAVMRHPDHIGSKDSVQFWSHHEKVVIVDYHYASIGGLDLCFGRWDTHNHPLADAHATEHDRTLFPGQDYNNARVLDFQQVDHYVSNQISTLETGRMPWHDVHMTIVGPTVLDIAQHFIERWNEVKKRKYRELERYEWLAFPHDLVAAPNEVVAHHPDRTNWEQVGHKYKERFLKSLHNRGHHSREREDPNDHHHNWNDATCRVQVVRSISDWSHGYLTEHSIQNAYIQMIAESNHFIYIENQFFISNTEKEKAVVNQIAGALVARILKAAKKGEKFKVIVMIPEVPAFAGDIKEASALQVIMGAQYRTINRGGDSIMEKIRIEGFNPEDYIKWYHLRSYDRINGPYKTFIKDMEEKTGITFHQAQVALARKWIGKVDENWVQDTVAIKAPTETKAGIVEEGDASKTEAVKYPETEEEAEKILKAFERGAGRADDEVSDTVAQHAMKDFTSLHDERWLGSEEEEKDCYITELLYIHSKVMIVDDRRVIMGSANLNDRSQKGDGDSEIALVVDDKDMIDSTMDGKPYKASRFAATLRRALFKEHLGIMRPQHCEPETKEMITSYMRPVPHPHKDTLMSEDDHLVADPLSEDFERLWNETAHKNTQIFAEIFKTVPSNNVRSWKDYEKYVPKVKAGHVATDQSIAQIKEKLNKIQGHIVEGAVDFLIEEQGLTTGVRWSSYDPTLPIYI